MIIGILILALGTQGAESVLDDVKDLVCLPGPYHKHYASPETENFPECHAFQNLSCCQYHIADEIHKHDATNLYNGYRWDHCGNLSMGCETYIADEECFYQCEPQLRYFQDKDYPDKGYVKGIPICASYCEAWFNACRNDKTCVVSWLDDFAYNQSMYHCPSNSTCRTFEEVYGNAEGLCNRMWGAAFRYEQDEYNCMLMHFDIKTCKNPNACAREDVACDKTQYQGCYPTSSSNIITSVASTLIVCLLLSIKLKM